jgi:hypothetical protein
MSRDLQHFIPTEPGRELWPGGAFSRLRVADSEGQFAHHGANWLSRCEKGITLINFGPVPYSNFELTETKQNSATITGAAGGVLFQTQATPTDGDKVEVISKRTFVPVAGNPSPAQDVPQLTILSARLQVSSAANMGLSMGFVTSGATGIIAANPNDGIFFLKPKNSTGLIARTVQGGGTAHDLASFVTASGSSAAFTFTDATDAVLTVKFYLGPTAAQSWGEWWINGIRTPFSAAQVADVFAMVAGAPSLSAHIGFAVNGTTQRSGTVSWAAAETDR